MTPRVVSWLAHRGRLSVIAESTDREGVNVPNTQTGRLRALARAADQVDRAETALENARTNRNRLIHDSVTTEPRVSERAAAKAARVSNAYAHRCVAGDGDPQPGSRKVAA